jgi:hypothetical protein
MLFSVRSLSFSPQQSEVTYHSKVLVALSAYHTLGYWFERSRFGLFLFRDGRSGSGTGGGRVVELIGVDRNTSLASFAYHLRSTRFSLSHVSLGSLLARRLAPWSLIVRRRALTYTTRSRFNSSGSHCTCRIQVFTDSKNRTIMRKRLFVVGLTSIVTRRNR